MHLEFISCSWPLAFDNWHLAFRLWVWNFVQLTFGIWRLAFDIYFVHLPFDSGSFRENVEGRHLPFAIWHLGCAIAIYFVHLACGIWRLALDIYFVHLTFVSGSFRECRRPAFGIWRLAFSLCICHLFRAFGIWHRLCAFPALDWHLTFDTSQPIHTYQWSPFVFVTSFVSSCCCCSCSSSSFCWVCGPGDHLAYGYGGHSVSDAPFAAAATLWDDPRKMGRPIKIWIRI